MGKPSLRLFCESAQNFPKKTDLRVQWLNDSGNEYFFGDPTKVARGGVLTVGFNRQSEMRKNGGF